LTQDLVILGIGGFGRGVLEIAECINEAHAAWNILGFLDDDPSHHGKQINDHPVLGDRSWLLGYPRVCVAVCVGSPAVRHHAVAALEATGHRSFATLCHPSAQLARRTSVGVGSIIAAGVLVDTGTTIGRHVLLSRGASVGHDVVIG
jgi:UDP-3-O-[3-hydroxymyristoyl] glucosamine N-acyltransferase